MKLTLPDTLRQAGHSRFGNPRITDRRADWQRRWNQYHREQRRALMTPIHPTLTGLAEIIFAILVVSMVFFIYHVAKHTAAELKAQQQHETRTR